MKRSLDWIDRREVERLQKRFLATRQRNRGAQMVLGTEFKMYFFPDWRKSLIRNFDALIAQLAERLEYQKSTIN